MAKGAEGKMSEDQEITNYWRALIKAGKMSEKDYFEKVMPCDILIQRAKKRQKKRDITKFIKDLRRYPHNNKILIKDLIEKWQKELEK